MTILFYKNNEMSPTIGGISKINCNLRDSLVRRGYTCYFLSSTYNKNIKSDKSQLWLPDVNNEYNVKNINWLHDLIINLHIDVIINNCFSSSSVDFLNEARKGLNCKLITWIHNNIVEYGSLIGFRKERTLRKKHLGFVSWFLTRNNIIILLRYLSKIKHNRIAIDCYNKSDNVVTVCPGNIDEFLYLLGKNDIKKKVLAIPNFICDEIDEQEDEYTKTNNIVWCGTVDFNLKKTNWMIDIWVRVQSLYPEWSLSILGDSSYLEELKKYAQSIGAERINFTGRVDPTVYYKKAAIICSTSISESFGLTIVEGMQKGVVPIAFNSSVALRDIIGQNGVLIKPFDLRLFAKGLSDLIMNTSFRDALSKQCVQSSLKYSEEVVVGLWRNLFEELR